MDSESFNEKLAANLARAVEEIDTLRHCVNILFDMVEDISKSDTSLHSNVANYLDRVITGPETDDDRRAVALKLFPRWAGKPHPSAQK